MHDNVKLSRIAAAYVVLAVGAVSAETLFWTGAESAVWDLVSVNWTNESGVATAWVNGSSATFTTGTVSTVSVTDDIQLRHMTMTTDCLLITLNDGGGSLTFVSDELTPTNSITTDNNGKHNLMNVRISCAGPLVKDGLGVLVLQNAGNDLAGSLVIAQSQLRFGVAESLGPGDVIVQGSSTLFGEVASSPDVKFVQSALSWMGSVGSELTVRSVGVTPDNVQRRFNMGRSSTGPCVVSLALTDPVSEGIGWYVMRGIGMKLAFDGGTVKAASETHDPFFTATSDAAPTARITNNGVTFDTAGSDVELGLTLTFDAPRAVTNVLETVYPDNWDFEAGSFSNWSVDRGDNPLSGEGSSVQVNESAFMKDRSGNYVTSYYTTNGTHFAVVRRYHTLSRTVTLPTAGLWRVAYERGCRPRDDYPSQILTMTVSLGDDANATVSPARSEMHPFRKEVSGVFALEAGPQTLKFAVGPSGTANLAVFLDAIRLERCEVVPVPTGPFVKTGTGSLVVTNLVTDGILAVSNGTLTVKESTFDGTPVEIAAGGTLELHATKVTNATVRVAAGGTLALHDGDGRNLVVNGGFEDHLLGAAGYCTYEPSSGPRGWTISYDDTVDRSGIQENRSIMSVNGNYTTYGWTTAFMRPKTRLSQTVTAPADGVYELTFVQGCRIGYPSHTIPLVCSIDGGVVVSNAARTASYGFYRSTVRVNLTAGTHELAFATGTMTGQYGVVFIDDVRLTSLAGSNALDGNAIAFESGATLDLQNVEPIYLAGCVTVDGRAVKGSTNALRRSGVTVTGGGEIQIGPPQGTAIFIK